MNCLPFLGHEKWEAVQVGETGLFLSLGLWTGEDNNRWQLF